MYHNESSKNIRMTKPLASEYVMRPPFYSISETTIELIATFGVATEIRSIANEFAKIISSEFLFDLKYIQKAVISYLLKNLNRYGKRTIRKMVKHKPIVDAVLQKIALTEKKKLVWECFSFTKMTRFVCFGTMYERFSENERIAILRLIHMHVDTSNIKSVNKMMSHGNVASVVTRNLCSFDTETSLKLYFMSKTAFDTIDFRKTFCPLSRYACEVILEIVGNTIHALDYKMLRRMMKCPQVFDLMSRNKPEIERAVFGRFNEDMISFLINSELKIKFEDPDFWRGVSEFGHPKLFDILIKPPINFGRNNAGTQNSNNHRDLHLGQMFLNALCTGYIKTAKRFTEAPFNVRCHDLCPKTHRYSFERIAKHGDIEVIRLLISKPVSFQRRIVREVMFPILLENAHLQSVKYVVETLRIPDSYIVHYLRQPGTRAMIDRRLLRFWDVTKDPVSHYINSVEERYRIHEKYSSI